MRRWITAIFTLHFLVSVGLFAMGQPQTQGMKATVAAASQALEAAADPAAELPGHPTEHGLNDVQPELPEAFEPEVAAVSTPRAPEPPIAPLAGASPAPLLDGPQRPPRSAAV